MLLSVFNEIIGLIDYIDNQLSWNNLKFELQDILFRFYYASWLLVCFNEPRLCWRTDNKTY